MYRLEMFCHIMFMEFTFIGKNLVAIHAFELLVRFNDSFMRIGLFFNMFCGCESLDNWFQWTFVIIGNS